MKNQFKINVMNRGTALLAGVILPISLLLTIPLFFKSELKKVEENKPIVLEMMALKMPKKPTKLVKKVTPKPKKVMVKQKKTAPPKKSLPKKVIKKTMLAKAKPVKKEMIKPPIKKQIQKVAELPKKVEPEVVVTPTMPIPVPIFKLTEAPQFLHRESLIYPEGMRATGTTGIVKLAVLIDNEGNVYRVKVIKSAGDDFDEAARKALLSSTFIPAKMGNKNVAVELRMPVKFRLL